MDQKPDFTVRHTQSGSVQILHLVGVLDQAAIPELDRVARAIPGGPGHRMVLDLSAVRYASSAGIAAFISLHRRLRAAGGILVLADPSESLAEMLLTLNLASLIPVHNSVEAGVLAAI